MKSRPADREVIAIHVLAESGDVPAHVRLKRFLKRLARAYGLRCIRVEPVTATGASAASGPRRDVPAGAGETADGRAVQ